MPVKRPFFSIVIPTYNRADFLRIAVKSVLHQDFDDYELIISDNASTDETEKVCRSFKNKKIIYSKNPVNIGFNRNMYKVIRMAKGRYVFVLSDDDFILNKDALTNVHRHIERHGYGFVRLKFVYVKDYRYLFSIYFKDTKHVLLPKNKDNITILEYIHSNTFYTCISGLIFRNKKNIRIKEIKKVKTGNIEISDFWIEYLLPAVKQFGAYVDFDDLIMVNWYFSNNSIIYNLINGKIPAERIWQLIFRHLNKEERARWLAREVKNMIHLFPSIKHYSSNGNLFRYIRRLAAIDNRILLLPSFYFYSFMAFLMPEWLWKKLRTVYQAASPVKDKRVLREFARFKKTYINDSQRYDNQKKSK